MPKFASFQIFLLQFLLPSYSLGMSKSSPNWLKEWTLKNIFSSNWTYQCHLIVHSYECNSQTDLKTFGSLVGFPWKQEVLALGVSQRLVNQYYLPQNSIHNFWHSRSLPLSSNFNESPAKIFSNSKTISSPSRTFNLAWLQ